MFLDYDPRSRFQRQVRAEQLGQVLHAAIALNPPDHIVIPAPTPRRATVGKLQLVERSAYISKQRQSAGVEHVSLGELRDQLVTDGKQPVPQRGQDVRLRHEKTTPRPARGRARSARGDRFAGRQLRFR